MNKVLGRGLDALFKSSASSAKIEAKEEGFLMLDPKLLKPNPYQPRRAFDEEALEELASSIKTHGLIQPVIAQKNIDGSYFIIAGERRTRASILAGLEKIPVLLSDFEDNVKLEVALIENIQREDLNPIEEAQAYQAIIAIGHLTQQELSERVGKSRPTITNSLRLLQLSPEMQEALKEGKLSTGHAKVLLGVDDEVKRRELFNNVVQDGLSVRETEELINSRIGTKKHAKMATKESIEESKKEVQKPSELKAIEEQFIAHLGTKVAIRGNMDSGVIEISFFSKEGLSQLYDAIIKN